MDGVLPEKPSAGFKQGRLAVRNSIDGMEIFGVSGGASFGWIFYGEFKKILLSP